MLLYLCSKQRAYPSMRVELRQPEQASIRGDIMGFNIGDRAVYPAQGVGVIEAIETREFSGQKHDFYILRICDSDMTIMVPTRNVKNVGMRSLVDKKNLPRVYDLFKETESHPSKSLASWSRRQREYTEKIKTGDLYEVAQVLRELYVIAVDKELSYGEKKMLDLARRLVIKEIAFAEGVDEEQITRRVEETFRN
jgi:CarD family transcriptional regulator